MCPSLCLASEGAIACRNSCEFGGCESLWILRCPIVLGLCLPAMFVDHPGDREIMLPIHELPTVAFALQHLRLELNTEASTLHLHWTGEVLSADALLQVFLLAGLSLSGTCPCSRAVLWRGGTRSACEYYWDSRGDWLRWFC